MLTCHKQTHLNSIGNRYDSVGEEHFLIRNAKCKKYDDNGIGALILHVYILSELSDVFIQGLTFQIPKEAQLH